jgi:hypothetical protein
MKYDQFADLCQREFAADGGDVRALTLAGPSAADLAADICTRPELVPMILRIREDEADTVRAGAALTKARNPVTLSDVAVTVEPDAEADTATVRCGPDGGQTRTVTID